MFSLEHYRALRTGSGLVDRSHKGRLRLTGRDRRDYLQGLLTNDVAALTAGTGCYACLLTAQGRMIADMYLTETGDAILMDLERDVVARVASHFEQFIFSEDVQVRDESDSVAQIGVFGPAAAAVVSRVLKSGSPDSAGPSPAGLEALTVLANRVCTWSTSPLVVVRRDDIGIDGFDLVIDRARGGELTQAISEAGAPEVDADVVEVVRVEAGRPRFHTDMTEDTIPLEAGIEDRALSMTKGCYVGQEIIIRVLHRGHGRVARRLVGLTLAPGASVPSPHDRIRAGDRDIGTVTSAVRSPALDRPIAMGYVHRDFSSPATGVSIVSGEATEPAVVTPLPFVGTPITATDRHGSRG